MNIMFVCTGNICRSAMAQWLLVKKLEEQNRTDIKVHSCGIYAQPGDGPTTEAIDTMKKYGVDLKLHRATNINSVNMRKMDLVLCATNSHKIAVLSAYPDLEGKVFTLKEYVGYNKEFHKKIDLEDPWGYGEDVYKFCASEINECLDLLLKKEK
ncbi:MAG: low molecular weight protein arginine phosphatase [Clostridia bacterium]|nr:low molecular weight protein arginine phosphatase [Clostridia bacterium]